MTAVIFGILLGSLLAYILVRPQQKELVSLKKDKEIRDSLHLVLQGGTTMYGPKGFENPILNYHLESWDAGKNWYVIDYNFDKDEFKVRGEAETIYPGLIEHLQAWNKLTDYVSKHGPLNPLDSNDIKVMNDAGLTVKEKF